MAEVVAAKVFRYDPSVDEKPYYETYQVPWKEYLTGLQALHYINEKIEPIGFDFSCRGGLCGRCACMIDGVASLACYTVIEPGEHLFEPLKGFRVIKDLVVDKSEITHRLDAATAAVVSTADMSVSPTIPYDYYWETLQRLQMCRECGNCFAACPVYQENSLAYAGPAVIAQISLRANDGLDQSDRVLQAVTSGVFLCTLCGECNKVCPSYIDHVGAHKELQSKAAARGLTPASAPANDATV